MARPDPTLTDLDRQMLAGTLGGRIALGLLPVVVTVPSGVTAQQMDESEDD